MKKFEVPVEWCVYDTVEVEAETFEDAIKYVLENKDDIPLGTEPEYIDGTYAVEDENDIDVLENSKEIAKSLAKRLESYGYGKPFEE